MLIYLKNIFIISKVNKIIKTKYFNFEYKNIKGFQYL